MPSNSESSHSLIRFSVIIKEKINTSKWRCFLCQGSLLSEPTPLFAITCLSSVFAIGCGWSQYEGCKTGFRIWSLHWLHLHSLPIPHSIYLFLSKSKTIALIPLETDVWIRSEHKTEIHIQTKYLSFCIRVIYELMHSSLYLVFMSALVNKHHFLNNRKVYVFSIITSILTKTRKIVRNGFWAGFLVFAGCRRHLLAIPASESPSSLSLFSLWPSPGVSGEDGCESKRI